MLDPRALQFQRTSLFGLKAPVFSWFKRLRLVHSCTVWCPTWPGYLCILLILLIPISWWCGWGESFLSLTSRSPAEVLVVEGWIGRNGVRSAAAEFKHHAYQYVVTTGEPNSEAWAEDHTSFADLAARELIALGLPKDKIIIAPAQDARTQRTFRSAVAVWRALSDRRIHPKSLNVFTLGPHARRSCLVFAKVFQSKPPKYGVSFKMAEISNGPRDKREEE